MTKQKIMAVKTNRRVMDLSTEVLTTFPNGGVVVVFNCIDRTTADFARIFSSAMFFAKQGKRVVLTPKVDVPYKNPTYDKIYGTLKGTPYYGKCPDFQVDGVWYEHEGFTGNNPKKSFRNMCSHGLQQSERLVIEDCGLTHSYMIRSLLGRIERNEHIKEVWLRTEKGLCLLFKSRKPMTQSSAPESTNP